MKVITYYTALVVWALSMTLSYAQEDPTVQDQIETLRQSKEDIVNEEKDALKQEVERINGLLDAGSISQEEAERLKKEAAEKHALNIEDRVAIVDNQIQLLERNGEIATRDRNTLDFRIFSEGEVFGIKYKPRKIRKDRRTTSDFVLAIGFNNVITEGESLEDSDFKIAGSRFAELGWAWKTRVFQNSNWLRVKYGFSFQFNGLKPTDNRVFVDNGTTTTLETFPEDLDKSKLRIDNLVFPLHFEFGPSNKVEREDGYVRYYTNNKLKIGVGGYAGFRLGTLQKLKYNQDGEDVKQKNRGNFNANNFIYGISGYIGWRDTALYVKYDLNPIFKDNPVKQRNISLGLRFDMD